MIGSGSRFFQYNGAFPRQPGGVSENVVKSRPVHESRAGTGEQQVSGLEELKAEPVESEVGFLCGLEVFPVLGESGRVTDEKRAGFIAAAKNTLKELLGVLGVSLKTETGAVAISEAEIEAKINLRLEHKRKRDFAAADSVRKDLESKGIILEDTKENHSNLKEVIESFEEELENAKKLL